MTVQNCGSLFVPYLNYPFELLGELTGGLRFEAVNHAPPGKSDEPTQGLVPSPSDSPHEHKLEVKPAAKSSGKVTEGKRSAAY